MIGQEQASALAGIGVADQLAAGDHVPTASLSPDEFRSAFRDHAAGVAIVTTDAGDGPVGMTVTSVFSVSASPPLLVFSVSELSSATPTFLRASSLVVHLLGAEEVEIARLFATSGVDRFADTTIWERRATGEPYLPAASTWVRGEIVGRLAAGGSTLIVVHATEAGHAARPRAAAAVTGPLVYHNRTWHRLGDESALR